MMKIGEALVKEHKITTVDVEVALEKQKQGDRRRLGEILVSLGMVSEADVLLVLFEHQNIPMANQVLENRRARLARRAQAAAQQAKAVNTDNGTLIKTPAADLLAEPDQSKDSPTPILASKEEMAALKQYEQHFIEPELEIPESAVHSHDPDEQDLLTELHALLIKKELAEVEQLIMQFDMLFPHSSGLALIKAWLYLAKGLNGEAVALIRQQKPNINDHPWLFAGLARAYFRLQNWQEAANIYQRLEQGEVHSPTWNILYAVVLDKLQKKQLAGREYSAFLKSISKESPQSVYARARLEKILVE